MSNQKLRDLISQANIEAENAHTSESLINVVDLFTKFGKPIKFDFTIHYIVGFIFLLLAGFYNYLIWGTDTFRYSEYEFFHLLSGIGSIVIACVPFMLAFSDSSSIDSLSKFIFKKDTLMDNNMTAIPLENDYYSYLKNNFKNEFSRGNHKRYFKGGYLLDNGWKTFHFHYVKKTTTQVPNGKGGTRTQTTYTHYDRYGITLPFEYFSNIEIKEDGSIKNRQNFKPSGIDFNRLYSIGAGSEHDLARFLKPTVILMLEDYAKNFSSLNIEIDTNGYMCISTSDKIMCSEDKRKYGVDTPEEFKKELAGFTSLCTLNDLKSMANELKRYSDNNFK